MKRMLGISLAIAVAAMAGIEFGCSNSVSPRKDLPSLNLSAAEKKVVSASGSFAFDLFGRMAEQAHGQNFFMSPLSVSMALAMTMNGASGQTYDDMQKTLGLTGLSEEEINQSYRNIMSLLGNLDPNVKFTIANSIWCRNTFEVSDSFAETDKEYFDAEVSSLDFSDPGAAEVMNSWISGKTEGKVQHMIDSPIDPLVVMYLINALYFNGTWQYTFDKDQTKPLPFNLPDGGTKTVPMMVVRDTLKFYRNSTMAVVELPYGEGDYSMLVLLPAAAPDLNNMMSAFGSDSYRNVLDGLRDADVQTRMPKFNVKYDTLLNNVLISMGMGIAFDEDYADFSRMMKSGPKGNLYISRVLHSTYLDVNEEGTEAAAATVVEMSLKGGSNGSEVGPIMFNVDRPFMFIIKENHENTIMFMGAVVDPGD